MTIMTKARRTRVTKADIAKTREEILAQPKPAKQTIEKLDTEPKRKKAFWLSDLFPDNYGDDIYFDSDGLAWGLETNGESCCVGETAKVLAIIKDEETIPDNACPHTKRILSKLLKDIEEEKDVKPKPRQTRRPHFERSRLSLITRHRR
jgi:hypothetical protein